MKYKLIILTFLLATTPILSQNSAEIVNSPTERKAVNQYISFVNKCNHYISAVSKNLNKFNTKINDIHEVLVNNPTSISLLEQKENYKYQLPKLVFNIEKAYQDAKNYKSSLSKRKFLLIDIELDKMYNQTKELQKVYTKIRKQQKDKLFEDLAFKNAYNSLKQVTKLVDKIIETNYSFSIASVIFYGKQTKLTPLLNYLNKKVALSKDIILGVRQKNKRNATLYYNNFISLKDYILTKNDVDALNANGFNIDVVDLKTNYILPINVSLANIKKITATHNSRGNSYLNYIGSLTKLLAEFNFKSEKKGIAFLYNKLVKKSSIHYKFFVEEPLPYNFWFPKNYTIDFKIALPKKELPIVTVTKPVIETETPKINTETPKVKVPKTFEKNNTKTLFGAKNNNLVLLIDVSRSMQREDKLPLLKKSIIDLVNIMRPEDRIAIAIYSGGSKMILESATISKKEAILNAIDKLTSAGGTNITSGLKLAYNSALSSFTENGNNKIILATDGDFKRNTFIDNLIVENKNKGVDLSIFHYGKNTQTLNLKNLKDISTLGNGNFKHIQNNNDATNALILEAKKKKQEQL